MRRREFITLLGGAAAAWPLAARAQQPTIPLIGFLSGTIAATYTKFVEGFHQGLNEVGYTDGKNIEIVYRWADNQNDRLPALAAELVRRQVAVIVATGGNQSPLAAKRATSTMPIVFVAGDDPVRMGLVASLNRPEANLTGVSIFAAELVAKRLDLLRELVPAASRIAYLINPTNPAAIEAEALTTAARTLGLQLSTANADTAIDIDAAIARFARERVDALLVQSNPFFNSNQDRLLALVARHALPTIYGRREFISGGGLISYGPSLADAYRQVGVYTGRILKGAKPADLPVLQPTKFELVINLKSAKALGLAVPLTLQVAADQVIE
jgi:putative ABC transport system substrate-binding protein